MGEISFLVRKAAADKEREAREWQIAHLETSIPILQHELKTVRYLNLHKQYAAVSSKLTEALLQYRRLVGKEYHAS